MPLWHWGVSVIYNEGAHSPTERGHTPAHSGVRFGEGLLCVLMMDGEGNERESKNEDLKY